MDRGAIGVMYLYIDIDLDTAGSETEEAHLSFQISVGPMNEADRPSDRETNISLAPRPRPCQRSAKKKERYIPVRVKRQM